MSSRDRILSKVRAGVASGSPVVNEGTEAERRATVAARLAGHVRHLVPERVAGKSAVELAAVLQRWIEMAGGELTAVASPAELPAAIAGYLRRHNLPQRVRIGADARLTGLAWASEPQLDVVSGPAERSDMTGVTHALAAVAETGTLVVTSGADNPVTLSFLPENNIVVVQRGDIVGPLEDAMARLREAGSGAGSATGAMPRTLNLISGPSRSADIGGIPVLGAHGPKRLCVMVVG
jgi:L-lactate dehydrogenase complex protein LldG